ncbi:hypothetical protein QZH41_008442 [Actinostola sp. cb2023]|nr:hypothetical protein QZH41_008442 [Actinostola sp. cb2023]
MEDITKESQTLYTIGLIILICMVVVPQGVRAPERPVVPNVTATSPTEIKMSWCRVKPNKIEIDHYELFIDNELEYSGIDVMYVAKRLKPWTWYEVKLRACGFQPGFSCSPFSRPILVKTLSNNENNTAIHSTASVFKVVVLPTYMFIAGVLVGVVILAMALIWRYLQSNDSWMNEPAFELPTHVQSQNKLCLKGKIAKLNSFLLSNMAGNTNKGHKTTKEKAELKDESTYHHIVDTEEGVCVCNNSSSQSISGKQEISVQTVDSCLLVENFIEVQENVSTGQDMQPLSWCPPHGDTEEQQSSNVYSNLAVKYLVHWHTEEVMCDNVQEIQNSFDGIHPSRGSSHKTFSYISIDNASKEKDLDNNIAQLPEHDEISHEINVSLHESHDPSKGVVIVVDNSNIYIGAQECASANNASDRKRHVRVKLQNLVKILENNRLKERTFVCGSSPPATEHVWDVYRHLGYVVDLEERRGKDEQRVDEGLHLFIYKAICELSPRVLVLASGDGMKGKSENSTSFPGCATMALDKGWSVEVYSWKHSLSAEWLKLAKKYPDHLTINYLDK